MKSYFRLFICLLFSISIFAKNNFAGIKNTFTKGTDTSIEKDVKEVHHFVEQMPRFENTHTDEESNGAILKYLSQHIQYPKKAIKKGKHGTVTVVFVVRANGQITDVHTTNKPLGDGLEEEAIRVVKSMPRWQPGIQDSKKVNVQFTIPIIFKFK